ncbi:shikimate dehydrogenase [Demetria terragena]|uniref:shikimate dehydrogenase n=1 Tax=Demetria terragena TaxID=63959 RepID=UPI000476A061|nr:shikimate dehydrogenase [Demetria terragena]
MARSRAAVLGSPIEHSLSPVLHRAAYAERGLHDWAYSSHDVKVPELRDFLLSLGPHWRGLSITMPLKEEALMVAEQASPTALQVGAANTLIRRNDGGWDAENTDVHGATAALAGAFATTSKPITSAAVIGSGATARAVLAGLHHLNVQAVTFVVRKGVRESTRAQALDHGFSLNSVNFTDPVGDWAQADVLVNTTPSGAATPLAAALEQTQAPSGQVVLDCSYADWPTDFAQACEQRGSTVVSGVEMLVHQAAAQFELMTGLQAPVEAMQTAGRAALSADRA